MQRPLSRYPWLLAIAVFAIASSLPAVELAGPELLVPIAGRGPGAHGSEWRTDLTVGNLSRTRSALVTVALIRKDATEEILWTEIPPRGTLALPDVLWRTFGHASATGMIRVTSSTPDARLTARARIYNIGSPQGEFGQIVPAAHPSRLARESYLAGLAAIGGNRTNVGIANGRKEPASVFLTLADRDGEVRAGFSTVVPAESVLQLNDVFSHFGIGPLDGATLQISASHGVYPWASIVRNDSGDADFVAATGIE